MSIFKIIVRISEQRADLFQDEVFLKGYRISTGSSGLGSEFGSGRTPSGFLRIAQKFGADQPSGTVFRSRIATGEVWSADPTCPLNSTSEDLVLTRILWLEGCEPHNANTIERYIYFHGTNQEQLIGTPASHGCIRMTNADIIELYTQVPEGTWVEVIE